MIGEALTGNTWGVYGHTQAGIGVYGQATTGIGLEGSSTNATGVYGTGRVGVWGESPTFQCHQA